MIGGGATSSYPRSLPVLQGFTGTLARGWKHAHVRVYDEGEGLRLLRPSDLRERLVGQTTPIHDHVSWCVTGVYRGREHETRYRMERDAKTRAPYLL